MARPVIGVIGNGYVVENRYAAQLVGRANMTAVAEAAGALPLMFAGTPDITDIAALMGAVDGILLTGARANVHPTRFGAEDHPSHEPYDQERDALALPLILACVDAGLPIFGICRGFQELNVAFGGSLYPEIRDLPGRMNHRMPRLENGEPHPDPAVIFAEPARRRAGAGRRLLAPLRARPHPRELPARAGAEGDRRPRRRRGRRRGRDRRGRPDQGGARLRARRPVARRARPADQPGEPGAVRGVRGRGGRVQARGGAGARLRVCGRMPVCLEAGRDPSMSSGGDQAVSSAHRRTPRRTVGSLDRRLGGVDPGLEQRPDGASSTRGFARRPRPAGRRAEAGSVRPTLPRATSRAASRGHGAPQRRRQLVGRIGLVDEVEAVRALFGEHVAVARRQHHGEVWVSLPDRTGEVDAVHASGHDDVRDDDIEAFARRRQSVQRLGSRGGPFRAIAEVVQDLGREAADLDVVLHD